MRGSRLAIAAAVMANVWISRTAEAGLCSMCRQTLQMGGSPGLIKGFFWSVLLIGGVPLLLLAVFSLLFYSHRRRPH